MNRFRQIITSNNFLSLANNGLIAVFGFLSFIMLVRMVPQETFGEWVLFITASNFIDMLRFGITRTALIRFLSGAKEDEARKFMGANNTINLLSTILLAVILFFIYHFESESIRESGFDMFFKWYPLLAFLSLPFNNAQSVLQAQLRFDKMLWLRLVNVGVFMIFLAFNIFLKYDITIILFAYLIANLLSSLIASILNWDGIRYIFRTKMDEIKTILNFGKYTTGTLIGSNLLKSSDTFIIGLSAFLGPLGVALYSIPLKLTEIIEIPLRSFAATAFPGMSKASLENNQAEVKRIFYANSGGTTFLMIPLMLFSFVFAEEIVFILGGSDYLVTANIFRIFCVYGLMLPIDRFIGVALDSVNQPKSNFIKVLYMTAANIFGDLLVVFGLPTLMLGFSFFVLVLSGVLPDSAYDLAHGLTIIKTLEFVAIITVLFTLIGIAVGFHYLGKTINIKFLDIFRIGFSETFKLLKVYLPQRKV
ncbi:MAG: oligosaccharide flippase family protein [Bacteroidales bacterium]|jgi:O-antigen/teichoic acid export membrane protein|nr:oligosaccharide flippase family protein [Bacteroidales bacterium]HOI32267.1 oligosaccharide flippase family protein [Bacteroidales bacterium]